MNKSLLSTALLTIMSAVCYAAEPSSSATTPGTSPTAADSNLSAQQPSSQEPPPAAATQPATIDCQYRIPAETTHLEQSLLSTWAEKAAVQAFDFTPATLDAQLEKLKTCFTEQGWQGFNDALEKSGNLQAIKAQQLTVSSQIDGPVKINPVKDNQWKVTLPMHVVYQNDKEKLTQLLTIDLLIGRKVSGDLGIMQIIASPRPNAEATPPQAQPSSPTTNTAPAATTNTPPQPQVP